MSLPTPRAAHIAWCDYAPAALLLLLTTFIATLITPSHSPYATPWTSLYVILSLVPYFRQLSSLFASWRSPTTLVALQYSSVNVRPLALLRLAVLLPSSLDLCPLCLPATITTHYNPPLLLPLRIPTAARFSPSRFNRTRCCSRLATSWLTTRRQVSQQPHTRRGGLRDKALEQLAARCRVLRRGIVQQPYYGTGLGPALKLHGSFHKLG